MSSNKLVYGVGVNDLEYGSCSYINLGGIQIEHQFYHKWRSMIARCYDQNTQKRQPSYEGCTVSEEWVLLSNFKTWFELWYKDGFELDKDLLMDGNKCTVRRIVFLFHEL